jgi:zinc/manganese transport system substrate-binding protein
LEIVMTMQTLSRRLLLGAGLAALALPTAVQAQTAPIPVTATFSIIGDMVKQVGGDRIALTVLAGPDQDAHAYQPAARDLKAIGEAKLVISNGLGFESWLGRIRNSSGSKAEFVEVAAKIKALDEKAGSGHSHGHSHGHGKAKDPHAWQSVANARIYVATIKDALTKVDPAGAADYAARAAAYDQELAKLDEEIKTAVGRWPEKNRRIISSHDAFQYFEKAYGVRFFAPRGMSTAEEANTRQMARLIDQIRKDKIPAVFIEQLSDQKLMEQISKETGAAIGGRLYADALSGTDGPAGTYISMMRHNIGVLNKALAPSS